MKKIKDFISGINNSSVRSLIILLIILLSCFSCNEDKFLEETPLDFASPENSYVTYDDFLSAVYNLHYLTRYTFWHDDNPYWWYGTDLVESYLDIDGSNDYSVYWGTTGGGPIWLWTESYQIIYDANVIINRSESDNSELSDSEKALIQAEARFFRGYFYKCLANIFGGVPLVLEEIETPRRDYVRATREQVYEQCVEDLKFAAENLPDIDEVTDESRINKLAANHVLAEVYVSLGNWQDAITEASKVIDHSATALITERFGDSDEKLFNDPDFDGDVYWDLFRNGNQDRSAGNTESLWVLQFYYNEGDRNGDLGGGGRVDYTLSRMVAPDLTKAYILQSNGSSSGILKQANTYYNHRGQGYHRPSSYFLYRLFGSQDLRNSKCNVIRDYPVLNPNNEYNGKWLVADNLPLIVNNITDTARFCFPTIGKVVTPGKDPDEYIDKSSDVEGSLLYDARRVWRKHYQIRLAETYLLRAEAYLGAGNTTMAAQDINVVRRRSEAPDVSAGDVDIDYILDERLRELYYEELRVLTLGRLSKIVDRTRRLNPVIGATVEDHQNLWAIPNSEIIKNTEGDLEQNPGY